MKKALDTYFLKPYNLEPDRNAIWQHIRCWRQADGLEQPGGQNDNNNQIQVSCTRNARGLLTELKAQEGGATLSDYVLGFDAAGNIGQVAASLPGASTLSGTTTFVHDYKLQLLSEQSTRSGGYGCIHTGLFTLDKHLSAIIDKKLILISGGMLWKNYKTN